MQFPMNPHFEQCMNKIPNSFNVLEKLDMKQYIRNKIEIRNESTLYYYIPNVKVQQYIAAFDIDWTITHSEKKLFSSEKDDIHFIPHRHEKLIELFRKGYTIALFTNQYGKSKSVIEKKVNRIKTLIDKLNIPCYVFIATGKDVYRKPETGMWKKFLTNANNKPEYAFYVGDALGRRGDFSDSDKEFAVNIGIPYYQPEDVFDYTIVDFSKYKSKTMVMFVGMAGSGKSTYYEKYLKPLHYVNINRDELKTKAKVMKLTKETIKKGENLVINATNPKRETREEYYKLARENNYDIVILYFIRDGYSWNELRAGKEHVPNIAYHIFFKNLEPPTKEEGELYKITKF